VKATRLGVVGLLPVGLALGVAAEWATLHRPSFAVAASAQEQRLAAADFVVGGALLVAGVVCRRRSRSRVGPLLVAAGFAWFLGSFASSSFTSVAAVGAYFVALHRGPLVHAVVSYPDGRLSRRSTQLLVGAAYAISAIALIGQSAGTRLGLAVLLALVAAQAFRASRGSARRARRLALGAALALAAALAAGGVAGLAEAGDATDRAVLWAYEAVIVLVAVVFGLDLVRGRWAEATVTSLVVDLGDVPEEGVLRERLATALGDRSLAIGYWSAEDRAFMDEGGRRLDLPDGDSTRGVTTVSEGDTLVAALLHDPATLEDPALRNSVAAAVRVAVANVRLQREIRRQAETLTVSRRRIVEAADLERRRLERELRERTDGRLRRLESLLAGAEADGADPVALAETLGELAAARTELGELARGIHPRLLTEHGLPAALADLARRAPVPVALDVSPGRLPAPLEAAAYFVCSEALANVAKHAHASRAAITVVRTNGRLLMSVRDDGTGGAEPAGGSGLRGLADRVEALGGRFAIDSPPGVGTTVSAELRL